MFNTLCYYLNFINPRIPAAFRRTVLRLMARRATIWAYGHPQAGWWGGVDVPFFGTVAFIPDVGTPPHVPYSYIW